MSRTRQAGLRAGFVVFFAATVSVFGGLIAGAAGTTPTLPASETQGLSASELSLLYTSAPKTVVMDTSTGQILSVTPGLSVTSATSASPDIMHARGHEAPPSRRLNTSPSAPRH
jgi:hypothetical protein